MKKSIIMLTVLVLLAGAVYAEEQTVTMKPAVNQGHSNAQRYVRFDKNGCVKFKFPTKSGVLLLRLKDKVLQADTNCDGKIDASDAPGIKQPDPRAMFMVGEAGKDEGEPKLKNVIPIPVKVGSAAFDYNIGLAYVYDKNKSGSIQSKTILKGDMGDHEIILFDQNVDGIFDKGGVDKISTRNKKPATRRPGSRRFISYGKQMELAPVIRVEKKLYNMQVLDKGLTLKFNPYPGPTAQLLVKTEQNSEATLTLKHIKGLMNVEIRSGEPGVFVPGKYYILQNQFYYRPKSKIVKEKKGVMGFLFGKETSSVVSGRTENYSGYSNESDAHVIELKEGENTLTPGKPLKLDFSAQAWKSTRTFYNVSKVFLTGAAGERYNTPYSKKGIMCIIRKGETEIKRSKLEFG
jgi:hypothetical protein